ncbi:response regulator [Noviherbaspirillum sp. CPCC 100848]|uniref:histidine kinase n=1 Tax=Noviherbaspirillum album TaxID=3080276 RepID=A0ABU6JBN4_9BURK|nr:response regulator [Noviherbaspirillum sp. CPCC 100848]MEC4720943.1 response regulator [Noviherbaspirillum sp. CPCC 100848]
MKPKYPLLPRIAGSLLCLLSLYVLTGWTFEQSDMIRIVPDSPAMAINTALMFLLSGSCLLLAESRGLLLRLYRAAALAVVLLAAAILSQYVFGISLGIDLPAVHAALGDGHERPGRTAPNACIGFIMAGLVFLRRTFVAGALTATARRRKMRFEAAFAAVTTLIGATALLVYLLNLGAMYYWASYNRMATMTALGIMVLGGGLWGLCRIEQAAEARTAEERARKITTLAGGLLTVFAIAAGLGSFALLRHGFEESARDNLVADTNTTGFSIASSLDHVMLLSGAIASQPALRQRLLALEQAASEQSASEQAAQGKAGLTAIATFRAFGQGYMDLGFSSVRIFGAGSEPLFASGPSIGDDSPIEIRLGPNGSLLWDEGLLLRLRHDILHEGRRVGQVVTERHLHGITALIVEAQNSGRTTDVVLCGRSEAGLSCFPGRYEREPVHYRIGASAENARTHPAMLALEGKTGVITIKDARGAALHAGHVPLSRYGLALVTRKEVSELYAPLRERLNWLFGLLALFIASGTFLMRRWVQPLVKHILSEQRRMKAILDNSNDAFIAVGPDGRISDWNLQAERTLGWNANEAIGSDLATLIIPEEQRLLHDRGILSFVSTGTGQVLNRRIEMNVLDRQGRLIPVEVSIAPFRSGEEFGASAFLRDLSEQKEAERRAAERTRELEAAQAALVQSQKLEAVGKLTGGVAHDFNNVLQVIKGSLQLIESEPGHAGKAARRITVAMSAVDRGATLAAQLLAFARRQPLQPRAIHPGRILCGMEELLRRALGEDIDIDLQAPEELWNILADPHQLENVILNLAINARYAMKGGGRLTIVAANVEQDARDAVLEPELQAGQYVVLEIRDTGTGMTAETRERAFEPFFTTKPEGEGTGLGLSMAYGFAKQSGGHISLHSEVGRGTSVKVYLPRSFEQEGAAPATAPDSVIEGGTETILVVEDDPAVRATVVDMLGGLGYRVLLSGDASSALDILKAEPSIALLFTDVVMPGPLRSTELARQASLLNPGIKVLFTSGYTQDAIVHGGRLDPGVHLLSKPYGRTQLAHKLRELLSDGPVRTAKPAGGFASASVLDAGTGLRIALAEDNDDFRVIAMEMLNMLGHRTIGFGRGEDALAAMHNNTIDVLLADISLPGMSGIELARAALVIQPALRVVFISGRADFHVRDFEFPCDMLAKPFTMQQLRQTLDTLQAASAAAE